MNTCRAIITTTHTVKPYKAKAICWDSLNLDLRKIVGKPSAGTHRSLLFEIFPWRHCFESYIMGSLRHFFPASLNPLFMIYSAPRFLLEFMFPLYLECRSQSMFSPIYMCSFCCITSFSWSGSWGWPGCKGGLQNTPNKLIFSSHLQLMPLNPYVPIVNAPNVPQVQLHHNHQYYYSYKISVEIISSCSFWEEPVSWWARFPYWSCSRRRQLVFYFHHHTTTTVICALRKRLPNTRQGDRFTHWPKTCIRCSSWKVSSGRFQWYVYPTDQ